jgi:ribosomal protein S18 acetylase RimI-like enzyme
VPEVVLRAPRLDEAGAIADAINAHSRSVHGSDDVTGDEIRSWFEAPDIDPATDMRVAVLPDGTVAGYADLGGGHGDTPRFWLDLRLRPGYSEAGPALIATMERRALERTGEPALLRAIAFAADAVTAGLFTAAGMHYVRSSYRMVTDLEAPVAAPVWPMGLSVRVFDPSEGDERVFAAHQDGFADHWEFHPTPLPEWRHWLYRPPFDPALWFLVEDGPEIAALCLCRPEDAGDPDMGWVNILTVRPPWRRRGLARALLLHAFAAFRERGRLRAGLTVDAENTTGAVALYEGAGMSVARRSDTYEKVLS